MLLVLNINIKEKTTIIKLLIAELKCVIHSSDNPRVMEFQSQRYRLQIYIVVFFHIKPKV